MTVVCLDQLQLFTTRGIAHRSLNYGRVYEFESMSWTATTGLTTELVWTEDVIG